MAISQSAGFGRACSGSLGRIERVDVEGDIYVFALGNLLGDGFGALLVDIVRSIKLGLSAFTGLCPLGLVEKSTNTYVREAGNMIQL